MKQLHKFFNPESWVMFQTWCLTFRASHLVSLCFCLSICKMRMNIFTYLGRVCRARQTMVCFHSGTANSEGKVFLRDAGTW